MDDSTFNPGRRNTLKVIGVAGSSLALPAWIVNAQAAQTQRSEAHTSMPANPLHISFSDSFHAGAQLVSLTNNSSDLLTVRHIYPGIVSTAGKVYDLNDLLQDGELTISAGKTQVYRLSAIKNYRSEKAAPIGIDNSKGKTLEVSTIERSFNKAHSVTTTRYLMS